MLLAATFLAASVARADDDLPPGFKADANDPFKDAEGSGSKPHGSSNSEMGQAYNGSAIWTPPGMVDMTALKPPLPDEAEGQPIDASQSVNATLSYVDHETQNHMSVSGGPYQTGTLIVMQPFVVSFQDGLEMAMVPIAAKFGVANLQQAISLKPSPRAENAEIASHLRDFEMSVLNGALSRAMAPTNPTLPTGNHAAAQSQDIPTITWARPQAPQDKLSDDEVLETLDTMGNNSSAPDDARTAMRHALFSANPALQQKLAEKLDDWIEKKQRGILQGWVDIDNLMTTSLYTQNEPCLALFPKWAAMKVYVYQHSENTNPFAYSNFVSNLSNEMAGNPDILEPAPVREGVQILITPINGTTGPDFLSDIGINYDFLAAVTGDAAAFKELLQAYAQMPMSPQGSNGQPTASPAENNGAALVLNGHPIKDAWRIKQFANGLLKNVTYVGSGDKKEGVLSHLDHAVYNQGKWTVTDPQFQEGAATAANVPSSFPIAPAPPPPAATTTPAPASDVPSSFPSSPPPAPASQAPGAVPGPTASAP